MPTTLRRETESRRSPRRAFNRAIGLLHAGGYAVAQSLQVSENGMSIVTPNEIPLEARLVITMCLPGTSTGLVLQAKVVSERSKVGKMFGYGLQFAALDLHQRRLIRGYVSAKTQAEAEADLGFEDD